MHHARIKPFELFVRVGYPPVKNGVLSPLRMPARNSASARTQIQSRRHGGCSLAKPQTSSRPCTLVRDRGSLRPATETAAAMDGERHPLPDASRSIPATAKISNLNTCAPAAVIPVRAPIKAAERSIPRLQQGIASLIPASAYASAQAISAM
jgi:hypothetical protein